METVTIEGVVMSVEAARNVEAAGVSPRADVTGLRDGTQCAEELLDACMDGVDIDDKATAQGWREYVAAVEAAANV